jgi:hypothetical protein
VSNKFCTLLNNINYFIVQHLFFILFYLFINNFPLRIRKNRFSFIYRKNITVPLNISEGYCFSEPPLKYDPEYYDCCIGYHAIMNYSSIIVPHLFIIVRVMIGRHEPIL